MQFRRIKLFPKIHKLMHEQANEIMVDIGAKCLIIFYKGRKYEH